jgi:hypothetical protein
MSVQITTTGDLSLGGAVLEGSDGTKYAVFLTGGGATEYIEIYEDIDGTPSRIAHEQCQPGSNNVYAIAAAIDSGDDIHIVVAYDLYNGINYYVFDTGTDTFTTNDEAVVTYSDGTPSNPGVSISLITLQVWGLLLIMYIILKRRGRHGQLRIK